MNVYDEVYNEKLNFVLSDEFSDDNNEVDLTEVCIGIHLHYQHQLEWNFEYIRNIPDEIYKIITVASYELKADVERLIQKYNIQNGLVLIKKNRGRDMSALLVEIAKYAVNYKYFAFVHDKDYKHEAMKASNKMWRESLWTNTIGTKHYMKNVVSFLVKNREIGLLVPPTPMNEEDITSSVLIGAWGKNYENVEKLINEMDLVCELEPSKPPIALGTCFWCRVDALRKLFLKRWKYEDFMDEPLPNDGTLSHAIERVLPYVAQDAGYKTAFMMCSSYASIYNSMMLRLMENAFHIMNDMIGINTSYQVANYKAIFNELMEYCSRYDEIYIYGAGKKATLLYNILAHLNIMPKGFIVTTKNESDTLYNLPIIEVSKFNYSANKGIILGVSFVYADEIEKTLQEYGIQNYKKILY